VSTLAGTRALIRLILRRDRVLMPLWVVLVGLIPLYLGSAIHQLYPTAGGLHGYAVESQDNSTFIMLYTRVYDDSLGGMTFWGRASPLWSSG
jgi:ABC-2 type transport system permease protein